jgi:LysR family nod box-dependent transcriptional activator
MRLNRLDLNLLVALSSLLDEQKITKAAARLNVSQSTMSGMLGRLRSYFEDELLVQVGRNMQLTPLARELAGPVRDLLLQIESTVTLRHKFVPETEQRRIRIIASDYMATALIIPLMRELRRLAPRITIELMAFSETPAEVITSGLTDLLIVPEELVSPDHPHERLPPDTYSCVAWKGNNEISDSLDMETFLRCSHVIPLFGPARQFSLDERFYRQHGIERKVMMYTHDFESMAQIVVGTDLLATMPTQLATACLGRYPIRMLTPPLALPRLQGCMQWHRHHTNDPCHHWLRSMLHDLASAPSTMRY